MKEVWKNIPDYEGLYQASNLGRVKGLKRYKQNHSKLQLVEEKIIKQYVNKYNGYVYVVLCKNGKENNCRVHKLIAKTFIPNPNNKSQINHIDGNKQNNRANNLEWCTCKENIQHAYSNGLIVNKQNIEVYQFDKNNNFIEKYHSLSEASKTTGISIGNISGCINGKRKSANSYIFKKGVVR